MFDQFKKLSRNIQVTIVGLLSLIACAAAMMIYVVLAPGTSPQLPADLVADSPTATLVAIADASPVPSAESIQGQGNDEDRPTATVAVPTLYISPTPEPTPTETPTPTTSPTPAVDSNDVEEDAVTGSDLPTVTPDYAIVTEQVENTQTAEAVDVIGTPVVIEPTAAEESIESTISLVNNTEHNLPFTFSGPTVRQVEVASGSSSAVILPEGDYRLEVRLPNGVHVDTFSVQNPTHSITVNQTVENEEFVALFNYD